MIKANILDKSEKKNSWNVLANSHVSRESLLLCRCFWLKKEGYSFILYRFMILFLLCIMKILKHGKLRSITQVCQKWNCFEDNNAANSIEKTFTTP